MIESVWKGKCDFERRLDVSSVFTTSLAKSPQFGASYRHRNCPMVDSSEPLRSTHQIQSGVKKENMLSSKKSLEFFSFELLVM